MYKEVIPHLKEKLTQWRYEPFDDAILLVIKYPCGNVSANLTENEKKNSRFTDKEANTLIYKHTILFY